MVVSAYESVSNILWNSIGLIDWIYCSLPSSIHKVVVTYKVGTNFTFISLKLQKKTLHISTYLFLKNSSYSWVHVVHKVVLY